MSHYDVIVIGSGAGGGTLVRRLAPSDHPGGEVAPVA
jgi:choline dehydrogenase-like flavoprotein